MQQQHSSVHSTLAAQQSSTQLAPQLAGRRQDQTYNHHDPFRIPKFFVAGGLAGALSRTATAPVDRLKMLLQVQEGKMMTLKEGIRIMAAEGSIRAYFKGNGTNVLKIAPETSIKLALNDHLRHAIHADAADVTPWERMVCGGISGAVGQGLVYPLDTVRTRLAVCHADEYGGIWQTAVRLYRTEGFKAFYRGLVPSMVRASRVSKDTTQNGL
eukprot:GHUV01010469.1.p1 GENE.GHUV01010469.1~~GHUV01010469.1.p1  ORF type:complete len:213 (+),score=50.42 GHUV01010469.1:937-1575(+)